MTTRSQLILALCTCQLVAGAELIFSGIDVADPTCQIKRDGAAGPAVLAMHPTKNAGNNAKQMRQQKKGSFLKSDSKKHSGS